MSNLRVTNLRGRTSGKSPSLPDGAVVTGVITATSGSFTGNVSIAGTLSYEDVTNIDSVGIVTARTGIKVLAGGINAVGVITATSFVGSGASLTGIESWNQFDTWLYGGG